MDINNLIEYCEKFGVNVTVDSNPSEEKIVHIKKLIERTKEIRKLCGNQRD